MIDKITMENLGCFSHWDISFQREKSIVCGASGAGKTILMDCIWAAMSMSWASLTALPRELGSPTKISATFRPHGSVSSTYARDAGVWRLFDRGYSNPSIVIYARQDGSFSLWCPQKKIINLTANEVWSGLRDKDRVICSGLLWDVINWQIRAGDTFSSLSSMVHSLIPGASFSEPCRLNQLDCRDIPTLSFGDDREHMDPFPVPVTHVSFGHKTLLSLAYLICWARAENYVLSSRLGKSPASSMIVLLDGLDAHLGGRCGENIFGRVLACLPLQEKQLIASTSADQVDPVGRVVLGR